MSNWYSPEYNWKLEKPHKVPEPTWNDQEAVALAPPPELTVSEWADARRVLQAGTSRQPGPWRTANTPYLREIMDTYNDPRIRHVVICAGTQLGKTETVYNSLGYILDCDPFSTLLVYPREDDAKTISRSRLRPMLEACPTLKEKIPTKCDLFQTLEMHFPGATLYLVGANSAAALSQKPCRNVLRDEIDKYPDTVGDDADPLSLSEARTKSFWDIRKIIDVSSPTLETRGIWKQLSTCDEVREFSVPCQHCGAFLLFKFENVKWTRDGENTVGAARAAWYECEHCGAKIESTQKSAMLAAGKWIATTTTNTDAQRVGYRISSLYSPWLTFGDVAECFVRAEAKRKEGDNGPLQDFINGWLADPWREQIEKPEERLAKLEAVRTSLPLRTVPDEAVALTVGIDTQKAGFWFVVRAWAKDTTSWLIDYGWLTDWQQIESLLWEQQYHRAAGSPLRIWRALIDTAGNEREGSTMTATEEVYQFLRKHWRRPGCALWGAKGSSTGLAGNVKLGSPLDRTPSGKPFGLQLVQIDTDKAKDALWWRIERAVDHDPAGAYLPAEVGQDYIRQVLAEEQRRNRKGVVEWHQIGSRPNHLLDCEALAWACTDDSLAGGLRFVARTQASATPQPPRPAQPTGPNPFTGRGQNDGVNPYTRR